MSQICPCGSQLPYSACCALIHADPAKAEHAEQLMRARYTAHVVANIDFILNTWHSSQRHLLDREQISQWSNSSEWLALNLEATDSDANYSYVTFTAAYRSQTRLHFHHEHSRFIYQQGRWWYLDGEASELNPGRNETCPCGSGKKLKRCCMQK